MPRRQFPNPRARRIVPQDIYRAIISPHLEVAEVRLQPATDNLSDFYRAFANIQPPRRFLATVTRMTRHGYRHDMEHCYTPSHHVRALPNIARQALQCKIGRSAMRYARLYQPKPGKYLSSQEQPLKGSGRPIPHTKVVHPQYLPTGVTE